MSMIDYDVLIYQIKQDIKALQNYLNQIENDNIYWDTRTVETLIEELEDKVRSLYTLTNPLL